MGSRLNALDSSREINEDFILHSREALSSIEDLDIIDATVKYKAQISALEISQQTYIQIQNLTIFNYI